MAANGLFGLASTLACLPGVVLLAVDGSVLPWLAFFLGGGGRRYTGTTAPDKDKAHVQNHTTWSTAGCEDISKQGKPCTQSDKNA